MPATRSRSPLEKAALDQRGRYGNGDGVSLGGETLPPKDDPHPTDRGNAVRVVQRHGADLHYCYPLKTWFVWDDRRWAEDQTGAVHWRVKETQRELFLQVADKMKRLGEEEGDDERAAQLKKLKLMLRHLLDWESQRAVEACVRSMQSEEGVPILPDRLDADPWLLNVRNGTIDLRTGDLREHRREDYLSKICPVDYDPYAKCPQWLRCLDRWMDGNADLVDYLQRTAGYAATADVREQCLWFFFGPGANGKSTYLNTLRGALGDYAIQAVSELLLQKSLETHPTERADLMGRRFVATVETDDGRRLAEAFTKQLTGGESLRARRMRQDFIEIRPTWKIFLAANHKPSVKGDDTGIWRRIKLVPWTVKIEDHEKDKDLAEKLKAEWPGILAWIVRGALDWQRLGLGEPEEVTMATDAYRAEQDQLAGFLDERCVVGPEFQVRASALRDAYEEWSGDKINPKAFSMRMEAKGRKSEPDSSNCRVYRGLGLRT